MQPPLNGSAHTAFSGPVELFTCRGVVFPWFFSKPMGWGQICILNISWIKLFLKSSLILPRRKPVPAGCRAPAFLGKRRGRSRGLNG